MAFLKDEALEVLQEAVKQSGLKQGFIADKIGVTQGYLSTQITGKKPLTLSMAVKLAKFLGVSTKKILQ